MMPPATVPPGAGTAIDAPEAVLRALAESRALWRDLVRIGADFSFETDAGGRFTLIEPPSALGWPAGCLIGTQASALLADPDGAGLNPFRVTGIVRHQLVWLRAADGSAVCLSLSAAPVATHQGGRDQGSGDQGSGDQGSGDQGSGPLAVRGLGIAVTERERERQALAETMSRSAIIEVLTRRMRDNARPLGSLSRALDDLLAALEADGAMVVLHESGQPLRVAASCGRPWPGASTLLDERVASFCTAPPEGHRHADWQRPTRDQCELQGQFLLLHAAASHFIDQVVLLFWRDGASWTESEAGLAARMLPAMLPALEHEQIQRETVRLSMTDILTGLLNRRGFAVELGRRFERLDADEAEASLFVVGLDGLEAVNREAGLDAGDAALREAASVLRRMVRAADLAGRIGGDVFALWLGGADQYVAAERAYALSQRVLTLSGPGPRPVGLSVGVAVRAAQSLESADSLLQRGWAAMRACKRSGGGRWHVSRMEPLL